MYAAHLDDQATIQADSLQTMAVNHKLTNAVHPTCNSVAQSVEGLAQLIKGRNYRAAMQLTQVLIVNATDREQFAINKEVMAVS